jgi:LCP family protein required for cell wall assembly
MSDQNKNRNPKYRSMSARPGQDILMPKADPKKKIDQFPGMGATLSSYQSSHDASSPKIRLSKQEEPKKKRRFFRKKTLKRASVAILTVVVLLGLFVGGRLLYNLHKSFGGSLFGILHSSKLKGEDSGRVNILLAGLPGANSGQVGGPQLTDSVMVVSLNTKNNTGWLLSIPRDLYVKIPGSGYGKINAAYEDGVSNNFSASGYPNGGMGQLEQIVSQKLGLPIDYYGLIDYDAFKQAVDAVGGINVTISSPDPRGLYDAYTHLKLPNGPVELNGSEALNLARARGDDAAGDISYGFPDSDFDRTMHQRQMLVSLKTKAVTAGVLANPVKLSNLFSALGDNVKTDFSLSDARRLYTLSKLIPNNKIASLNLQSLLTDYTDPSGQEDLVPAAGFDNYSQIQAFVAQHTSSNPIVQENASVVVLNGTDADGVAQTYKNQLTADHVNVSSIGDAYSSEMATTQIIDNSNGKDPETKALLEQKFGTNVTTTNPYNYRASFIVVVGNDKIPTTAGSTDQ